MEDIAEPAPGRGQVLLRVHAAGVNPIDTYIRAGASPGTNKTYVHLGEVVSSTDGSLYPYTPGMDAAGVVEAVGEDVSSVRVGDRVYTAGAACKLFAGAYAELMLCGATRTSPHVHRLPPNVSFAQGAALGVPYATAYYALVHQARAHRGETVFVHGASGGVGIAAIQIALAHGLTVIGSAGTERGLRLITEQNAHFVVDHSMPGYMDRLAEWTGGRGVDVILENLANVNLARDIDIAARFGRIVVIGSRGTIEIDPRAAMTKNVAILTMMFSNASSEEVISVHSEIIVGLEDGTLRPFVGHEFPLRDVAAAHRMVMAKGAYGKIVLIP
jgi:NADPH2:quinone reductase